MTGVALAQTAPSVSNVMLYSTLYGNSGTAPNVFTVTQFRANLSDNSIGTAVGSNSNFRVTAPSTVLSSAVSANIATALSIIPLTSPASGVIFKKDSATGAELPVNSTLGPIFTERAETIGKGRFFIGLTHQNFHFTSINGDSLNGMSLLDPGGANSSISVSANSPVLKSKPVTYNVGMDIRLSQDIAFLTYGVTNRFDVSLGLPVVHASMAASTTNGQIYVGDGLGGAGDNCWCTNTFTPGTQTSFLARIGAASQSKTGFGDVLLRLKGTVLEKSNVVAAIGTDLRFPTGDENNYLGVGAMAVKPFLALSLYSKPLANGIVISPHANVGWQFIGKSSLGGQLVGTTNPVTLADGTTVNAGGPFHSTKDYLPDVFSWAVGTEIALGRHNTLIADILGNQIGWIHGIPGLRDQSVADSPSFTVRSPFAPFSPTTATGFVSSGRTSFGQYSGSFGYKARIAGNLVATFNLLVRLDNNGLTSRIVPMYGLGYSF
jgi:hypothetical protein